MAGTRLLIASVFVTQLLVLAGTAFYFGLCRSNDLSCIPFLPQSGRATLKNDNDNLLDLIYSADLGVTVLVPEQQLNMWQASSSEYTKKNSIHWKAASSETLQRICSQQQESSTGNILPDVVDVIVCNESQQTKAQVYFSPDGIVFFYPRAGHEIIDWEYLLPRPTAISPETLQFQFLIEQDIYNKSTSTSFLWEQIQEWSRPYQNLLKHRVSYHSHPIAAVEWLPVAIQKSTRENSTVPEWRIPLESVTQTLRGTKDTTTVAFYIPGRDPVVIVGDDDARNDSWLIEEPNAFWLAIFSDTASRQNHKRFKTLMDTVLARGCGIPALGPTAPIDLMVGDNDKEMTLALPHIYTKLAQQYQIRDAYTQVTEQLQSYRQLLVDSPRTMYISEEMASVWFEAYQLLEQATRGGHPNALGLLQKAMDRLEQELERNPKLSPPIDFSREHYFGIFIPLLIPLLLPNLFGLFRELKRYRESVQKKKRESSKEKQD